MAFKISKDIVLRVSFVCFLALLGITAAYAQLKGPVAKAEKAKAGGKVELFENQPLQRWSTVSGNWQVHEVVEANVDRSTIYRSPEEPSHLAWIGIWKAKDGSISIRFPQLTGDPGLEPSYQPWAGRVNFADYGLKDWEDNAEKNHLLLGPPDALIKTRLHFITLVTRDNAKTWQKVSAVLSPTNYSPASQGYGQRMVLAPNWELVGKGATLLCRDGRIVDTATTAEIVKEWQAGKHPMLGLHESFDNGKTWSPVQWVSGKFEDGKPFDNASEEHSFVELDDGRLLFMIRSDAIPHPLEVWLTRRPNGQYTASPVVETTIPLRGLPSMVRGSDGTIWYWGTRHYYSLDNGKSWQGLPDSQVFPGYYGKMLAAGNRILCVTQKGQGDAPYPNKHDSSVEQIRISSRRVGVMYQTDPGDSPALLELKDQRYSDLHLRADVKLDQAEGLAFHITPDGKSYYAFMVVMPGSEARKRWEPTLRPDATLSFYFPGLLDAAVQGAVDKGVFRITPKPIAVLARVDDGRVTVLRGVNITDVLPITEGADAELKPGTWGQLQVKVRGDLIQAAFSDGSDPPVYVGVHDATYKEGAIGLLTDGGSQGEFKDLSVWSTPQMIRDLWTPAEITTK